MECQNISSNQEDFPNYANHLKSNWDHLTIIHFFDKQWFIYALFKRNKIRELFLRNGAYG